MKLIAFSEDSPFKQIVAFVLIMLISMVIFTGLAMLTAQIIWGEEVLSHLYDYSDPNVISALKYIQGFTHFGLFLVPALIFGMLSGKGMSNFLNANKVPALKIFVFAVVLLILANPLIGLLMEWNASLKLPDWLSGLEEKMRLLEENAKVATEALIKANTTSQLLVNLLIMAILPALGEEFVFRGFLMRYFSGFIKNIHINILIAAILFSAMHLQFYGFLPRMALGIMFGYLFYWSGSIWIPVLAHFINNGAMVLLYYFMETGNLQGNPEEFGTVSSPYFLIVNAIIFGLGIYWFYQNRKKEPMFN